MSPPARAALAAEVERLTASAPGRWSVVVSEGGAPVIEVRAEEVHRAASTVKLPLLTEALRAVEAGRLGLDDELAVPAERDESSLLARLPTVTRLSLVEALELMVTVSDNVASVMVVDALGGLTAAASALEAGGWRATQVGRYPGRPGDVDNLTTAADLAAGLERLVAAEGLAARLARELLGRQRVADRLPAYLDDSVGCLHKPGELDGVRHDAGVLLVDGREVVVVVLGSELADAGGARVASPSARTVIGGTAAAVVAAVRAG